MKSLCYIVVLSLTFFGCSLIELDDEEPPPTFYAANEYSHYMICRGVVTEKATNVLISGMRMRITKRVTTGFMGPSYNDSVCETITNEHGEYSMKFWYDKNYTDYTLQALSDSTLLPNPNYIPLSGFMWFFTDGAIYNNSNQLYPLYVQSLDTITVNPSIPGYAYITIRLKQKSGWEEPMSYKVLVNDTVKYTSLFPLTKDSDFGKTLLFVGNEPQKVEVRLYRTIQSNKYLSKMITPVPTKLLVEEFEF